MAKIKKDKEDLKLKVEDFDIDVSDEELSNKKNKVKKKRGKVVPLLIVVLIFAGIIAGIMFNFMSVRDKYIYPLIKKIPIVSNLVPETTTESELTNISKEELDSKINELEIQVADLTKENEELKVTVEDRNAEINNLKTFGEQQQQFKIDKEEFDRMVANSDIKSYLEFYEKIFPENADKIYRDAIATSVQDKNMKKYINTFSNMDEESSAKILEELMLTDIDLVISIMKNLDAERGAAILSSMTTKNAAVIAKRMSP